MDILHNEWREYSVITDCMDGECFEGLNSSLLLVASCQPNKDVYYTSQDETICSLHIMMYIFGKLIFFAVVKVVAGYSIIEETNEAPSPSCGCLKPS